ncbi:MAG: type II toxin-antitoxin system HicA family toxin [Solirubrobacteraceae bacterium]
MSERLPVVSGQQLIGALEKGGWVAVRQRGSHVRLKHDEHAISPGGSASSRAQARHSRRDLARRRDISRRAPATPLRLRVQGSRSLHRRARRPVRASGGQHRCSLKACRM